MENNSLKLYRVFREIELERGLISEFALLDGIDKLDIPNEIYSHVLGTKWEAYPNGRKVFFSFTDSFEKAKAYYIKNKSEYAGIGYIELPLANSFNANSTILYLKRIYKIVDWIDLIVSYDVKDFETLNYITYSRPYENTLLAGNRTASSWAKSNNEYVVICNGLKTEIINDINTYNYSNIIDENIHIDKIRDIGFVENKCNQIIDAVRKLESKTKYDKKQDVVDAINQYLDYYKKLLLMKNVDKKSLYKTQKDTLDKFLERGAITKEQYEKSLNTLKEKMGIND